MDNNTLLCILRDLDDHWLGTFDTSYALIAKWYELTTESHYNEVKLFWLNRGDD